MIGTNMGTHAVTPGRDIRAATSPTLLCDAAWTVGDARKLLRLLVSQLQSLKTALMVSSAPRAKLRNLVSRRKRSKRHIGEKSACGEKAKGWLYCVLSGTRNGNECRPGRVCTSETRDDSARSERYHIIPSETVRKARLVLSPQAISALVEPQG